MNYLPPLPPELQQVEYVKLYFHLQVKDNFALPPFALLQLRRELLQALRTLGEWGGTEDVAQLHELLQPSLSADPQVRRQVQKPAPAFVLYPDPALQGSLSPKQIIVLPVIFLGRGIQDIDPFVSLLQQLGQQGLCHGRGQFLLEAVEGEDAVGTRMMHWTAGRKEPFTPLVSDLGWLLEQQLLTEEKVILDVISPLRLLQKKKPLFKASFVDLFPFVLRRVSSMLANHSAVELFNDAQAYIEQSRQVDVFENRLQWQDWRCLQGASRTQEFGGLLGSMVLSGNGLSEVLWILRLGSILNVGKGATYGSGQYRLRTYC